MPIWASMLAWPVLGERPNLLRVISLVMAFAGLASIMGGNGLAASVEKLPGIIMALGGAVGFAVGTVMAKKLPLNLLDAIRNFEKDKHLIEALGSDFSAAYIKLKMNDWNQYCRHLTQWERDTTLDC